MDLIEKIKSKTSEAGIIGLGYVGLPLVIEFCKAGFPVTGFAVDPRRCSSQGSWRKKAQESNITIPWSLFAGGTGIIRTLICGPLNLPGHS